MKCCDCDERIGIKINSWKQFEELKSFFKAQVEKKIFVEKPVKKSCYFGRKRIAEIGRASCRERVLIQV